MKLKLKFLILLEVFFTFLMIYSFIMSLDEYEEFKKLQEPCMYLTNAECPINNLGDYFISFIISFLSFLINSALLCNYKKNIKIGGK